MGTTGRRAIVIGAVGVALTACEGAREGNAPTRTTAPPHQVEVSQPDWQATGPANRTALEHLSPAARSKVATAPVPMLVPQRAGLLRAAVVTSGEHFAAFSGTADGINVAIQGTRAAHRHEGIPKTPQDRTLRGQPGRVTRNEMIWTASWIEGGIAYGLDLECIRTDDVRCGDDRLVVELVEELVFVGGEGSR